MLCLNNRSSDKPKSHNTGVFTECFKPNNSQLKSVELLWQSGLILVGDFSSM